MKCRWETWLIKISCVILHFLFYLLIGLCVWVENHSTSVSVFLNDCMEQRSFPTFHWNLHEWEINSYWDKPLKGSLQKLTENHLIVQVKVFSLYLIKVTRLLSKKPVGWNKCFNKINVTEGTGHLETGRDSM